MTSIHSSTTPRFWKLFAELPAEVQDLAFEKYELFKKDPYHPSLCFQAKGKAWTIAIGRSYRAIAYRSERKSVLVYARVAAKIVLHHGAQTFYPKRAPRRSIFLWRCESTRTFRPKPSDFQLNIVMRWNCWGAREIG